MQYTESVVDCLKGIAQKHLESIDWQSACEQVKDPRRKQGQRFSITSIVLLALAAILSNHLSELVTEFRQQVSWEEVMMTPFESGGEREEGIHSAQEKPEEDASSVVLAPWLRLCMALWLLSVHFWHDDHKVLVRRPFERHPDADEKES